MLDGLIHLAGRTVARDHTVVALVDEPAHHIEAHPPHAPDTDVHVAPPFGRRKVSGFRLQVFPVA